MKSKFNTYRMNLLKFSHILIDIYIKNIYHRSSTGQDRSKLLDFATIYPSESKIGNLGK